MKRTDKLFQLIKSLNKAEKRYFKLFAQSAHSEGEKNYIQLFDAIDRQEEYDEQRITSQFRDEKLVKQFSVAKNYLYNSILRALVRFYKGPGAEIDSLDLQIRLLLDKNLTSHAEQILRKAKLRALSMERFGTLIELLALERALLRHLQDYKRLAAFRLDLDAQEARAIEALEGMRKYRALEDQVSALLYAEEGDDRFDQATAILGNSLLVTDQEATSVGAKVIRLNVLSRLYRFTGDIRKSSDIVMASLQLMDSHPDFREENIYSYVMEAVNLCRMEISLKNEKGIAAAFARIESINTRSEKAKLSLAENGFAIRVSYFLVMGEPENCLSALQDFMDFMQPFRGRLRKKTEMQMYYFGAAAALSAGDPKGALYWCQLFIQEPESESLVELQCYARLLRLMALWDQHEYPEFRKEIKSAYRFFTRRDKLGLAEKAALRMMNMLSEAAGTDAHKAVMVEGRSELIGIHDAHKSEMEMVRMTFITEWLTGHITGTPMKSWFLPIHQEITGARSRFRDAEPAIREQLGVTA